MDKILIKTLDDFVNWRNTHIDYLGNFECKAYGDVYPREYPCILIENEEYDECSYIDKYYGFVYMGDFNN